MMRAYTAVMVIGMVAAGCGSQQRETPDAADSDLPDASTCTPIQLTGDGRITAPTLATAPVVDGNLSDWSTCFISLNHTNAGLVRSLDGVHAYPVGRFSIARHGDSVFLAAVVTGLAPLGDDATNIRNNDNIEVYIDGDGQTQIGYGTDAREIVIDHAGRVAGFRAGAPIDIGTVQHAAAQNGPSFTIEVQLDPASFDSAVFAPTLGFDFGISDGDGSAQTSELVWTKQCFSTVQCMCFNGDDAPYCDSRQFGRVAFSQ
jgi:cellulose/xylan binding protein with CBM9 domain